MVNEVNSLIFNTLIAERAVHLPEIGTLRIERRAAEAKGDTITAPEYVVTFSSHHSATSITRVIATVSAISQAEAEDIYARWRDKSQNSNELIISNVGTLRGKSFVADSELIAVLNYGRKPSVRIKRRRNMTPWVAAFVLIIIALGGVLYIHLQKGSADTVSEIPDGDIYAENGDTTTEDIIAQEAVTEDITEAMTSDNTIIEETTAEEDIEAGSTTPEVTDWRTNNDIRHRVVVGSYSTIENAERAVHNIEGSMPELKCDVFQLGSMYAVAIFGSTERNECVEFQRSYSESFSQLWIHTPKRFR